MSDSVPAPTPAPVKTPNVRGLIKKVHEKAVSRSEHLLAAAQKAVYAPTLAAREIDASFLSAFAEKIANARTLMSQAIDKSSVKTSATRVEKETRATLISLAQEVQRAAKQKFADEKPEELKNYFIGSNLKQNRVILEQAVTSMLEQLKSKTLPGITKEKITTLSAALKSYKDSNDAQIGAQADASGKRLSLENLIDSINKDRRKILYAIDASWPSDNKNNGPIRIELGLSADRPFAG